MSKRIVGEERWKMAKEILSGCIQKAWFIGSFGKHYISIINIIHHPFWGPPIFGNTHRYIYIYIYMYVNIYIYSIYIPGTCLSFVLGVEPSQKKAQTPIKTAGSFGFEVYMQT